MEDTVKVEQRKVEVSEAQRHRLTKPSPVMEKRAKRKGVNTAKSIVLVKARIQM